MANDWLRSGATVLDLPQSARQSAKGLARQPLVEQTLTADNFVAYYEVRTTHSYFCALQIDATPYYPGASERASWPRVSPEVD